MKLTNNQEQIREYAASKGIFIQVYREEKLSLGADADGEDCRNFTTNERMKQVFENLDPMSYKDFNESNKLPFLLFDTSMYKDDTEDIPQNVLDMFKEDKLLSDIIDELGHVGNR